MPAQPEIAHEAAGHEGEGDEGGGKPANEVKASQKSGIRAKPLSEGF